MSTVVVTLWKVRMKALHFIMLGTVVMLGALVVLAMGANAVGATSAQAVQNRTTLQDKLSTQSGTVDVYQRAESMSATGKDATWSSAEKQPHALVAVGAPVAQPTTAAPDPSAVQFLYVVPEANGDSIEVSLGSKGQLPGDVFANIGDGPTGFKDGWTNMPYSSTIDSHVATIPFQEAINVGNVNITSTAGVDTPDVIFKRSLLQDAMNERATSVDEAFVLTIVNTDVLDDETYMIVANNRGQPGQLRPADLTLLSPSYTIRRDGDVLETTRDMELTISYRTLDLQGAVPQMLDIYRWHDSAQQWIPLHANWLPSEDAFSVGVRIFGTYALGARASWQSTFADLDLAALEERSMVRRGGVPDRWVLNLRQLGSGSATSRVIAPSFGIERWDTLTFTATTTPPTATLTMDLLSVDHELLLADVQSSQSLDLPILQDMQALRLRVNMTATVDTSLPALHAWQVTWQQPQPGRIQVGDGSLRMGETITVPVALAVAPQTGLSGATVDLLYDPALVQPTACAMTMPTAVGFCNPHFDNDGTAPDRLRFNLLVTPTMTNAVQLAELTFVGIGWNDAGAQIEPAIVAAVDASGNSVPLVGQSGLLAFAEQRVGDVNCDGQSDGNDVALILAHDAALIDGGVQCPPPEDALFLPQCDLNNDQQCDLLDAQELFLR